MGRIKVKLLNFYSCVSHGCIIHVYSANRVLPEDPSGSFSSLQQTSAYLKSMQAMTEQNENGHSVYQNLVSQTPFHCARFPLCQALRVEEALGKPRHHNSLLLTRYQQPWYSFMVAAHLASRRIICIVCGLNATLRDRPLRLDLWGEKSSYLAQAKTLP